MGKKITDDELVLEGYKALYAAATPPADFEKLVNECLKYVDKYGKVHYTEKPLTSVECMEKEWRKDIGYMDYELEEETYRNIVESIIKKYKLNKFKSDAFRNTMYLGSGPCFKKKNNTN